MLLETALVDRLEDDAAVSALAGDRIYPSVVPELSDEERDAGTVRYPAITYFVVDAPRTHFHDSADSLVRPRIQLDCWAELYSDARELAEAVRRSLDHFHAVMTVGYDTLRVALMLDSVRDMGYEDEAALYRVSLDFFALHQEVPA